MLPPGHIAAGYLTAEALLKLTHPNITLAQSSALLWWGVLFGFLPDLDTFYVFFQQRAFRIKSSYENNHRKFFTHAPILWLIPGLLIYFLSKDVYHQCIGLVLWLASWSHFLLDSIEDGVMWLWPFSSKQFALRYPSQIIVEENKFFNYWWKFTIQYATTRLSFYFEVLIIISAIIIFFK